MISSADFPETITLIPESERLAQTFGIMIPMIGLVGALTAALMLTNTPLPADVPSYYSVTAFIGIMGIWLIIHDLVRRRNRRILVRRNDRVAVYKRDKLEQVFSRCEITEYVLEHLNSIKFIAIPLIVIGSSVWSLVDNFKELMVPEMLWWKIVWLIVVMFSIGWAGSLIYTRYRCLHFRFPRPNGRMREIIISKQHAQKLDA